MIGLHRVDHGDEYSMRRGEVAVRELVKGSGAKFRRKPNQAPRLRSGSVVELYQIGTRWAEPEPSPCPVGHELGAGRVLVGSPVCSCEVHHHRTHARRRCDAVVYTPPMIADCTDSSSDVRAR